MRLSKNLTLLRLAFFIAFPTSSAPVKKIPSDDYKLIFPIFKFSQGDNEVQPTSFAMYNEQEEATTMVIDTAFDSILIQNSTEITQPTTINYNGTIQGEEIQAGLNLKKIPIESTNKVKSYKVDISKIPNWTYPAAGILGLSPSSPYWGYFSATYEPSEGIDQVSVVIDLKNKVDTDAFNIHKRDFSKSTISIGKEPVKKNIAWFDKQRILNELKENINTLKAFVFTGIEVQLNQDKKNNDYSLQNICLLSDTNFLIALNIDDYADLGKKVLNQLCGVDAIFNKETLKFDKNCKKSDKDYSIKKVNNMNFKFKETANSQKPVFEMPIKSKYFISEPDDDNTPVTLGFTIMTEEMSQKCGGYNSVKMTFGRQFLLYGSLVVEVNDKSPDTIYRYGIQSKVIVYSEAMFYIFMGLSLFILVIIVVMCLKPKSEIDEFNEVEQKES